MLLKITKPIAFEVFYLQNRPKQKLLLTFIVY